mmetsp:Transcript_97007/g.301981  ORF Transcript_97007/g.301981 Transcript_97007/m.301981 type:complete len:267 (+) Transcript_97007:783-1583(+)
MERRRLTLTPSLLFAAFTATGEPWSQPATTKPKDPAPRSPLGSSRSSLRWTSQCSAWPSASTLPRQLLISAFWSSSVPFSQWSTSTGSKMRPVTVVSGREDIWAADWSSSSRGAASSALAAKLCTRLAACSSLISTAPDSEKPCLLATLMPTRKVGICSSMPSTLLPTTKISTGILAPVPPTSVVGNNTGLVLARCTQSCTRLCSSSGSEPVSGWPAAFLPTSTSKRWSARTILPPSSESHTVASHIIASMDSISAFSTDSSCWTS